MNAIALYLDGTIIYWASVVIALGIAAGTLLSYSLYTGQGKSPAAYIIFAPIATVLSIFLARFIHWYCHAEQYSSLAAAMTDFSSGDFCMTGVLFGTIIAALIVMVLGIASDKKAFLDSLGPGFLLTAAFIRFSALFNSTCRSKIPVNDESLHFLPLASPVINSSGIVEWRFATFFAEALVLLVMTLIAVNFYARMRKKKLKDRRKLPTAAFLSLLLFCAAELLFDSTRYDASFARSNGFVSLTQMVSAISMGLLLILYSIWSIKANGFKLLHLLLILLFIAGVGVVGYNEYLVQRHGDWYLRCYPTMAAAIVVMVVSVQAMYRTLLVKPKR